MLYYNIIIHLWMEANAKFCLPHPIRPRRRRRRRRRRRLEVRPAFNQTDGRKDASAGNQNSGNSGATNGGNGIIPFLWLLLLA